MGGLGVAAEEAIHDWLRREPSMIGCGERRSKEAIHEFCAHLECRVASAM